MPGFPFWPHRASAYAGTLDFLFISLLVIAALTTALVVFLLILFAAKYRHTSAAPRDEPTKKTWRWEVGWTTASLLVCPPRQWAPVRRANTAWVGRQLRSTVPRWGDAGR